jgi:HAMP domain-containing protein
MFETTPAFYVLIIASLGAAALLVAAVVALIRQRRRERNRRELEAVKAQGGVDIGGDGAAVVGRGSHRGVHINDTPELNGEQSPDGSEADGLLPRASSRATTSDRSMKVTIVHAPAEVGAQKPLPRYSSRDCLSQQQPAPRGVLRASSRVRLDSPPPSPPMGDHGKDDDDESDHDTRLHVNNDSVAHGPTVEMDDD